MSDENSLVDNVKSALGMGTQDEKKSQPAEDESIDEATLNATTVAASSIVT